MMNACVSHYSRGIEVYLYTLRDVFGSIHVLIAWVMYYKCSDVFGWYL